jgi:hypothetical protein
LISTIETQNAYIVLLELLGHVAWLEFTGIGTPDRIHEGAPSIESGITRRKQWWTRKGYKRLADSPLGDTVIDRTALRKKKLEPTSKEVPGNSETSTQIEVAHETDQFSRVASSGTDSTAAQAPDGLDLTLEGRSSALAAYTRHWSTNEWSCSEASLARTAKVHPSDLSKWKRSRLPVKSEKRARIEKVLSNNEAPTPKTRRKSRA